MALSSSSLLNMLELGRKNSTSFLRYSLAPASSSRTSASPGHFSEDSTRSHRQD